MYDFYVTDTEVSADAITVTTAKQFMDGNPNPTLDSYLATAGVLDAHIGDAIEKLEGLPNGLAQVTVQGRNSKIIINQSW